MCIIPLRSVSFSNTSSALQPDSVADCGDRIIAVKSYKPRIDRGAAVLDKHMSQILKQGC